MVFEDSDKIYVDILESARDMKENAIVALFGDSSTHAAEQATSTLVFNSTSWPCTDVVAVPGMSQGLGAQQVHKQDQATLMVTASVPSSGMQIVSPVNDANVVPVSAYCNSNGHFVLENLYVMAKFNASSHLASFCELIPKGWAGNMMCLHDVLIFWDAWDIKINHLHKFSMMDASSITIINEGPLLSSIAIEIPVGKSSKMKHYVSLSAVSSHLDFDCNVNWHESHKCLKTAFTWDICSKFATYKTQYSVVQRPTHHNTTWDMAKFRVCAHKFGDLSEFGYGIALLNDSKYGYVMLDSTMTIILLRSPKLPNANCDMGHQSFCYT
ncbi:Glycoside hydrolase, 38 vacuolar alpha mannosidase, partial [Coemansia erecta]